MKAEEFQNCLVSFFESSPISACKECFSFLFTVEKVDLILYFLTFSASSYYNSFTCCGYSRQESVVGNFMTTQGKFVKMICFSHEISFLSTTEPDKYRNDMRHH